MQIALIFSTMIIAFYYTNWFMLLFCISKIQLKKKIVY